MESEKLGIKIEAPVRIRIGSPAATPISGRYYFLLILSVLLLGVAFFILSAEIFNLPLSNQMYKLLTRCLEWLSITRINF